MQRVDKSILLVVLFLLGLGLIQVYSSSYIYAIERFHDGFYFFKKQLLFVGLGIVVLFSTFLLPWRWLKILGWGLWILSFLGVLMTLVSPLGVKVGGAQRWLQFPYGWRLQPSEFLKVSYPFVLLWYFSLKDKNSSLLSQGGLVVLLACPLVLLLKQPDFGSVVIISVSIFLVLFAFDLSWKYVWGTLIGMSALFFVFIISAPYRLSRLMTFLDPWSDPSKKGFQVIQSMLSFHSGELTGKGLGMGQGKLFFLPEAHNDFILAVLGEELGFVGFFIVVLFFGFLFFKGLQVVLRSEQRVFQVVGLGSVVSLALSTFVNMGVVLGLLPTKGLALPFLSYGGSALISACFSIGVLLNIEKETRRSSLKVRRRFIRVN